MAASLLSRRVDRTHDLLKTIEREIIQALSKSEPLAFREIRGPIQRPTHQLTDDRVKGRFAAVSKGKKGKKEKQKGQTHREDSTATTQRKPR